MRKRAWLISLVGLAFVALMFGAVLKGYNFLTHRTDPYECYADGGVYTGGALSVSSSGATVYSSPRSGHGDIYLSNIHGKTPTKIIFSNVYEGDACISPDSKKIAYVEVINSDLCLLLYDPQTKASRIIGASGDCKGPAFSLDGKKILYDYAPSTSRQADLRIYDCVMGLTSVAPYSVSGVDERTISGASLVYYYDGRGANGIHGVKITNPAGVPVTSGQRAVLSPQGNAIAFLGGAYNTAICAAKLNGSQARVVYTDGANVESVNFTPDEKSLIFLEMKDNHHYNIVLCNVQSGAAQVIGSEIP